MRTLVIAVLVCSHVCQHDVEIPACDVLDQHFGGCSEEPGCCVLESFYKSLQRAKKRASCRFQVCEADVKVKALAAVGLTELD